MPLEYSENQPAWVNDAVFYQIFPDRFFAVGNTLNSPHLARWGSAPTRDNFFGGNLAGIRAKLDHIQNLGANAIYLNPIFRAETNHRYDTTDYFTLDPLLGEKQDLIDLVSEGHRRSMRVLLDGVFNHSGDHFPPFVDVLQNGAASRYSQWFTTMDYPLQPETANYLSCGGCAYLPKLNHHNPEVRDFLYSAAKFWLEEAGIDGWRLDVPYKIHPEFWQGFRQVVKAVNPRAYLVGEIWREAHPWIKGDTFDGVTNYRLRELILDYVKNQTLDAEDMGYELVTLLRSHAEAAGFMLNLLGSHDTPRILNMLDEDIDYLRIALALQMAVPGAPMVYYGDEVGLPGGPDPDCRRSMPWEVKEWNQQVYEMTSQLISIRSRHPALRYGMPTILLALNGVLALKQTHQADEVILVCNPREEVCNLPIAINSEKIDWVDALSGESYSAQAGRLIFQVIPAKSVRVLVPVGAPTD